MALETRRSFNRKMLASLMTYGLIETVFSRGLFADAVKPVVQKWLVELADLSKDLKDQKIKDLDFQAKLEGLYQRVDLAELIAFIDLDRAADVVLDEGHRPVPKAGRDIAFGPRDQVVHADNFAAEFEESPAEVGAQEAGATGDDGATGREVVRGQCHAPPPRGAVSVSAGRCRGRRNPCRASWPAPRCCGHRRSPAAAYRASGA